MHQTEEPGHVEFDETNPILADEEEEPHHVVVDDLKQHYNVNLTESGPSQRMNCSNPDETLLTSEDEINNERDHEHQPDEPEDDELDENNPILADDEEDKPPMNLMNDTNRRYLLLEIERNGIRRRIHSMLKEYVPGNDENVYVWMVIQRK